MVGAAAVVLAVAVVLGAWLLAGRSDPGTAVKRWIGLSSACGNGQVDPGEECDDGNTRQDDGCLAQCKLATCGDGIVRRFVEECDDGNRADGDACSSSCLLCPPSPQRFSAPSSGHCYWKVDEAVSWKEASRRCAAEQGHLVTFSDDLEWREVTERLLAGGTSSVWIGLRMEDRNGVQDFGWVWGERVLSAHWSVHEPRRVPSDLDCGRQLETGAWAASDCKEPRGFVCERPAWAVPERGGHAYRRFAQRVSWHEASERCKKSGGHLVTFSNLAEQAFVATRFQGAIWLGSTLDEKTGKFTHWVTGEPFSYEDFAPGDPNVLHRQKCLALDIDRRWYNRECDDPHGFVCEIE